MLMSFAIEREIYSLISCFTYHRVTVLDLSSNFLKIVPSSELRVLSANIKWLSLSQNALQYVPREIRNMLNLRYLDLSNNYFITRIPTGKKVRQVKSLKSVRGHSHA